MMARAKTRPRGRLDPTRAPGFGGSHVPTAPGNLPAGRPADYRLTAETQSLFVDPTITVR
jgi:hypothetical protein